MKKILLLATLLTATVSFAQRTKATTYTTTTTAVPITYSSGQNELTANVGFQSGAINLGATYAQMSGGTGFGGYFLLQTEKTSAAVNQAIALGGLYKINVIDTSKAVFYAAPGAGLAMIKVPSSSGTGTDDKTVFGPSLKLGVQFKVSPTFAIGVENMLISNWFEDKAPAGFEIVTVAMSFVY
jgi:opacity protein-like surface antigen